MSDPSNAVLAEMIKGLRESNDLAHQTFRESLVNVRSENKDNRTRIEKIENTIGRITLKMAAIGIVITAAVVKGVSYVWEKIIT